jgi:hypothetical protein
VNEIVADVGNDRLGVGDHQAGQSRISGPDKMVLEKSSDPNLANAQLDSVVRNSVAL